MIFGLVMIRNFLIPINTWLDLPKNNYKISWILTSIKNRIKNKIKIIKFNKQIKDKIIETKEYFKIDIQGFKISIIEDTKTSILSKYIKNIIPKELFLNLNNGHTKFSEINNFSSELDYKLKLTIDSKCNTREFFIKQIFLNS